MRLARFNPSPELSSLQRQWDWMSDHAFGNRQAEGVDTSFAPAVDVAETDHTLEFYVEVPGLEKDQLDIRVVNETLVIGGERRFEQTGSDTYHRIERAYGKFQRLFSLPTAVDTEKVKATLKNGVLHVVLAKSESAKPRQIQISA